jgi:flagellar protein FlaJ
VISMPRSKKGARKPSLFTKFLSAVGGGVIKTGSGTAKAARSVGTTIKTAARREGQGKEDEVTRRLRELKRLETLREEELAAERKLTKEEIEEKIWAERIELKRPLSERLAESFYGFLKRPAQRMSGFFKGLGDDLFKANMQVAPERYIALILGMSLIVGGSAFIVIWLLVSPFLALLGGFVGFIFTLMVSRTQPRSRAKGRFGDINRAIPYALRHMATQLSSGIGLPETMTSVSQADYGALSEEFERVIRDMHSGISTEEALSAMDRRVESDALQRAVRQIQRTMRTGGDLAKILSVLADETAFDLRMKLRDYVQSLNMLTMIYMFVSAVIPAMLIVMMLVMGFMGGAAFPTEVLALLYLVFLPFMLFYFVRIIRRMEPRV